MTDIVIGGQSAGAATLAASVTPLMEGGTAPDYDAIYPLVAMLVQAKVDGLLALGTTGEGILFTEPERRKVAESFVAAAPRSIRVMIHCGAQTSRDTARLAAHAAESGADGVAVMRHPTLHLIAMLLAGTSLRPPVLASRCRSSYMSSLPEVAMQFRSWS